MFKFTIRNVSLVFHVIGIVLGFNALDAGKQMISIKTTSTYKEYAQAKKQGIGSNKSLKVTKPVQKPKPLTDKNSVPKPKASEAMSPA